MATESVVGIVIQARDEATRVLQQVRGELALFGPQGQVLVDLGNNAERGAASVRALGTSASTTLPAIKSLSNELLTGLSPALGQVGIAVINVVQATDRLRLGLPTLAAAGAAAATVFGVELVAAVNRSREAFREWQRDVQSFDLSRVSRQATQLASDLEKVDQRLKELGKLSGPGPGGFPSITERIEEFLLGIRGSYLRGQQRETLEAQRFLQFGGSPALPAPGQEDPTLAQAQRFFTLRDQQRGLFDFLAPYPGVEGPFREQLRQAEDLRAELQGRAAGRLEAFARRRREFDFAGQVLGPQLMRDIESTAGFEQTGLGPSPQEIVAGWAAAEKRFFERFQAELDEAVAASATTGLEAIGIGPTLGETRAGVSARLGRIGEEARLRQDALGVERDLLAVELERANLSDRQRDSITESLAGLREQQEIVRVTAELQQARERGDEARVEQLERELEVTESIAQIRRQMRAEQIAERDDPVAGALRGLEDFEQQVGRAGERARFALLGTMQTLSSGITEILVQGISGDFERIADVGKQMGQALMRGLLQELVVAPIVSSLSGAIRGALGSLGGGLGSAAAAGGGVLGILGLGGATTASAAGLVAPGAAVGSIVQTAAGPAVVGASGALVLQGGPATTALLSRGGEPSPDLLAGVGDGGTLIGASGGAGFTVMGGLGAAAGIAAVGFSAYGGYTSATTTQDVVFSGLTGALAGAAAGAQIGGMYDSTGYGALIGAVAGAAISAGAAAFGKSRNRANSEERQRAEMQAAGTSFQPLFAELDAATTPEEFYDTVRRYVHQGAGGLRSGEGDENAGLVVILSDGRRAFDSGVTPVEFVEGAAKGVTVQIVLGVAAEVKAPLEQRIARAIQQAAQRIKSLGPRIFFTEQLEGGISRTTVLGLMRLAEASGQDISVVAATLNGLDPVARQKILDRIAAQDVDGAVDIYAVESNLQRVRVGQHRAVTAAAGGTLTPAQAGQVNDVIDQAVDLGPDEIARRFREGIISQGGGEPSPNDPSGPVGPGINSVSFDGPNINVTMDDGTTLSVTPGSPSGLAGQGVAGALTAMGVPSGLANAIGSGVDLGITFGLGGIGGMLNTAAGLVVGLARGRGPLSGLPSISVTPPNAGRGLDPDEGFTPEDDAVPEGVVTVGEPTIADAPDGSGPGAPGDGTGGVGAGGTGSSGDPSAYAEGGWVRGRGRRDTVRARLTPGEFVATRGAAAEHGAELEEMNRRAAGNYPRAPEPPPMSDEQIEQVFTRARSMSLKRDLGWFPGDRNMPRPAAWAI